MKSKRKKTPHMKTPKVAPIVAAPRREIAPPETLLDEAKKAPRVFNIGAYFRPIYIMREKGHSWRDLVGWLKRFNIEISHEHLRRLFMQEDKRLSRLSREDLRELGMPQDIIEDTLNGYQEKSDPTKRLPAIDAQDIALEEEEETHGL
jgi:hypothetical protein